MNIIIIKGAIISLSINGSEHRVIFDKIIRYIILRPLENKKRFGSFSSEKNGDKEIVIDYWKFVKQIFVMFFSTDSTMKRLEWDTNL